MIVFTAFVFRYLGIFAGLERRGRGHHLMWCRRWSCLVGGVGSGVLGFQAEECSGETGVRCLGSCYLSASLSVAEVGGGLPMVISTIVVVGDKGHYSIKDSDTTRGDCAGH